MLECEANPGKQRPGRWFMVSNPQWLAEKGAVQGFFLPGFLSLPLPALGGVWEWETRAQWIFPSVSRGRCGRKVASCHPSPRCAPAQGCDKSGCAEGLTQRQSSSAESPTALAPHSTRDWAQPGWALPGGGGRRDVPGMVGGRRFPSTDPLVGKSFSHCLIPPWQK